MTVLIPFNHPATEEEAQENAAKWRRKADAQPDISYLPNLSLLWEFGCKVIWVANIFIPTKQSRLSGSIPFLDNGVEVVAVELGNETYSQVDHDFGQFLSQISGLLHGTNQWTSLFHTLLRQRGKPFKERPSVEQLFAIILLRQLFTGSTGITMGESFQA